MSQKYYWKTHPIDFKILGSDIILGSKVDRFTGKLIQSSILEIRGMPWAVLLENSSIKLEDTSMRIFLDEFSSLMDEFSSNTAHGMPQNSKRLDEFSSNTSGSLNFGKNSG